MAKMLSIEPINLHKDISQKKKEYSLPSATDGLTPIQRHILWTAKSLKLSSKQKHRKTSKVISECGGDSEDIYEFLTIGKAGEIYNSIKYMTQKQRDYELLHGNGNFGSGYSNSSEASPRFNEIRLSAFCEECILVNHTRNKKIPDSFISKIPGALVFGTECIANGFVSRVPSHNLCEVIDAMIAMIDNPDISPAQLTEYIKGPDFFKGGTIVNKSELTKIYQNGEGKIRIQGKATVESTEDGKQIVISELPATMNKEVKTFVNDINDLYLLHEWGIKDIRDESYWDTRIVIELFDEADPDKVKEQLFKLTQLEGEMDCQFILLYDGVPCRMSLYDILATHLRSYRHKLGDKYNDEQFKNELLCIRDKYGKPRKTQLTDI